MKKYAWWVKCLTFFLTVVMLLGVAVSGLGILMAASMDMYTQEDYQTWRYSRSQHMAENLASQVIEAYAGQFSQSPQWLLEQTGYAYAIENAMSWYELTDEDWYYTVTDRAGEVVAGARKELEDPLVFRFEDMYWAYPIIVERPDSIPAETTVPTTAATEPPVDTTQTLAATEPVVAESTAIHWYNEDEYYDVFYDPYSNEEVWVQYDELSGHQVEIGVRASHSCYYVSEGLPMELMPWLFSARYLLIVIAAVCLLLFAAIFAFLMYIAGKDPKNGEVNPQALNRLPLDLYLAAAVGISVLGAACIIMLLEELFQSNGNSGLNVLFLILLCGCGVIVATVDVGFFTALAAQWKLPDGAWWKRSLCGRLLRLLWKGLEKGSVYAADGLEIISRYFKTLFKMLPVIWHWIAAGGIMGIVLVLICLTTTAHWYTYFPLLIWCLVFVALVTYCGYSYGVLYKGIQRLKAGDLNEKIATEWLFGSFKALAEDLNTLVDVVALAAQKQMKAERMKTELITNVSHDIKTPLTSVINYVDLLQQPHTEEEGIQYLEVLSRQSLRLKKLVEDLMDMSKASSGNMAVNITAMDAVEAVNQALGEFADKLEGAKLTAVFRSPDSQLHMLADGKITWRVLSNLLSNVVKYAMPGTRVYLDLLRLDKCVVLSVKNISREELNISAEELTERFVRGDTARNTEGSGLGLNIAQSLMGLQQGSMDVTVDGDLFKVTLTFPTE